MKIHSDWHIHTEHSYDDACLKMDDLVAGAAQKGINEYGVTDHLNTSENLPDIENSRNAFDQILSKYPHLKGTFHFGVEVDCIPKWKLNLSNKGEYRDGMKAPAGCPPEEFEPGVAIDPAYVKKMGIEFVVGGAHSPSFPYTDRDRLIEDYHRQNMYLARHECVDILAHYLWWYPRDYASNPFEDFNNVPVSMRRELAPALKEGNCAFELNLAGILYSQRLTDRFKNLYLEYAAELQSMGVMLAIGSDCHRAAYTTIDFETAEKRILVAGIDLEKNMFSISP